MLRPLSDPYQTRIRWQPFITGLILNILLWLLIWILLVMVIPVFAADGLPEECPDLYDPAVVQTFRLVRQLPYRDGRLRSTILAADSAYSMSGDMQQRKPLVFMIGYLTDTKDGRIVAIVETFLHVDRTGHRSLRGWADRGFLRSSKATGEWDSLSEGMITPPLEASAVSAYLHDFYKRLDAALAR